MSLLQSPNLNNVGTSSPASDARLLTNERQALWELIERFDADVRLGGTGVGGVDIAPRTAPQPHHLVGDGLVA
jgi:hypothetical protein